jgi:hypothetical protein
MTAAGALCRFVPIALVAILVFTTLATGFIAPAGGVK